MQNQKFSPSSCRMKIALASTFFATAMGTLAVVGAPAVALAETTAATSAPAESSAKPVRVVANVNGMVCGMCVQSITKKLEDTGKASEVNVDLKGKKVTFSLKSGETLSDDEIKKALADAGYAASDIQRSN